LLTGGTQLNGFIIFDYQSATDFKYAGLDATANLLRIGQRTTAGWIDKATVSYNFQLNSSFSPLLAVNGTSATLTLGKASVDYKFAGVLASSQLAVVGHRNGTAFYVDASQGLKISTGMILKVALKGSTATLSANGTAVVSYTFNSLLSDGRLGLFTQGGVSNF